MERRWIVRTRCEDCHSSTLYPICFFGRADSPLLLLHLIAIFSRLYVLSLAYALGVALFGALWEQPLTSAGMPLPLPSPETKEYPRTPDPR